GYRYIGEPSAVESAPFRERGFYVSAIVLLPELPNIFAAISSSDWPIRVLRFQVGPNPYATSGAGSAAPGGFAGGGGMRRGMGGIADEDDRPTSFGMAGGGRGMGGGMGMNSRMMLANSGLASAFSGSSGFSGLGGFGGRGGMRGGMGGMRGGGTTLPISMRGPSMIDPNWFANPDLVQVDFCGIITMYNPQTDDTVVPESDGSSADATDEAIAAQEEVLRQAAEEAAVAEEKAAVEAAAAAAAAGESIDAAEGGLVDEAGGALETPPAAEPGGDGFNTPFEGETGEEPAPDEQPAAE
ncbi:MAG: hypothetical protein KF861_09050, partial [Planctomycetaceae bacterium]|nr:hypothetical protein [Planctomycetaceae bacterium]